MIKKQAFQALCLLMATGLLASNQQNSSDNFSKRSEQLRRQILSANYETTRCMNEIRKIYSEEKPDLGKLAVLKQKLSLATNRFHDAMREFKANGHSLTDHERYRSQSKL